MQSAKHGMLTCAAKVTHSHFQIFAGVFRAFFMWRNIDGRRISWLLSFVWNLATVVVKWHEVVVLCSLNNCSVKHSVRQVESVLCTCDFSCNAIFIDSFRIRRRRRASIERRKELHTNLSKLLFIYAAVGWLSLNEEHFVIHGWKILKSRFVNFILMYFRLTLN